MHHHLSSVVVSRFVVEHLALRDASLFSFSPYESKSTNMELLLIVFRTAVKEVCSCISCAGRRSCEPTEGRENQNTREQPMMYRHRIGFASHTVICPIE